LKNAFLYNLAFHHCLVIVHLQIQSYVTVQEIPGGGSSSEQVLSFLIAVTARLINYIIVC